MKHSKRYIIFFSLCGFASCMPPTLLTSKIKVKEVRDVQYFEPLSYISLIEAGNKPWYNDSLSNESKKLVSKIIENNKQQIPITEKIVVTDTLLSRKLEAEFNNLVILTKQKKSLSKIKITPIIDSLLDANNKRFGLITVATGFTRVKKNYSKQVAKGTAVGLLTLGMYVQSPVKSASSLYVLIADARENNIAFYSQSELKEKEPLSEKNINKQFLTVFKGYFLPRD
jgi:hypothetical protein